MPTNPISSLAEACDKDINRGVAFDLFVNGLDLRHGKEQWRDMERFEMSQSKSDSRASMTARSSDMRQERGVQRDARHHTRELVKANDTLGLPQPEQLKLRLNFSRDNLPSSYRWVPIRAKKQFPNMLALWVFGAGWKFKSQTRITLD